MPEVLGRRSTLKVPIFDKPQNYESVIYYICECGLTHYEDEPIYNEHYSQKKLAGVVVYEILEGEELARMIEEDNKRRKEKRKPAGRAEQGVLFEGI